MNVETYEKLLKGECIGRNYSHDCFFINDITNNYKKQTTLKEATQSDLTPPKNLNQEVTIKKSNCKGKSKKPKIDSDLLKKFFK